jgi:hypothetical protein
MPNSLIDILWANKIIPIFPITENEARLLAKITKTSIIDDPKILTAHKLDKYVGSIQSYWKKDKMSRGQKKDGRLKMSHLIHLQSQQKTGTMGITLKHNENHRKELKASKDFLRKNIANIFHLLVEKEFGLVEGQLDNCTNLKCEKIHKNQVGDFTHHLRTKTITAPEQN